MICIEEKNHSVETGPGMTNMIEFIEKDIKRVIITIFHILEKSGHKNVITRRYFKDPNQASRFENRMSEMKNTINVKKNNKFD